MPRYLVESYSSGAAVDEARERARLTARLGTGVTYVRTTFLPGEETVFHMFDAPSAEAVDRAGRLAALPFQRIVEAIEASLQKDGFDR
jgi:hypothetical protein